MVFQSQPKVVDVWLPHMTIGAKKNSSVIPPTPTSSVGQGLHQKAKRFCFILQATNFHLGGLQPNEGRLFFHKQMKIFNSVLLWCLCQICCENIAICNTLNETNYLNNPRHKTLLYPTDESSNPTDSILPGNWYYGKTPFQLFKQKRTIILPDSLSDSRYSKAGFFFSPGNRYLIRKSGVSEEVTLIDWKNGITFPLIGKFDALVKNMYFSIYDSCHGCAEYFYQHRMKYLKEGAYGSELEFEATEIYSYDKGILVHGKFRYLDSGKTNEFELKRVNLLLKLDYNGICLDWIINDPLQMHSVLGTYQFIYAERTYNCIHLNEFENQQAIMTLYNLQYCCGYDSARSTNLFLTTQVRLDWQQHRIIPIALGPIQVSDGMRQRWTSEFFPSVKLVQHKSTTAWIAQVEHNLFVNKNNTQTITPIKFQYFNVDSVKSYNDVKGFDEHGNFFAHYAIFNIHMNKRYVFVSFVENGMINLMTYDLKRHEIIAAFQLNQHVLISVHGNQLTFKDTKSYLLDGQTKFEVFKIK
jgi:hypothetical protein